MTVQQNNSLLSQVAVVGSRVSRETVIIGSELNGGPLRSRKEGNERNNAVRSCALDRKNVSYEEFVEILPGTGNDCPLHRNSSGLEPI